MKLSGLQIGAIIGSFLLLGGLLLFGRTTPNQKKGQETKQEVTASLDEETVLAEARNNLDSAQLAWLADLDRQKSQTSNVIEEARVLKLISGTWFDYGNSLISAYYAKKVAELLQTGDAWSIAGTTYEHAFRKNKEAEKRKLAAVRSVDALEKAKELEPDTLRHQVNLALMNIELSTVDASVMPMKGVMQLRDLSKQNPDNVEINMHLGRLSATRTRDWAKAKPRFEKVLEIAQRKSVPMQTVTEAYFYLIECYKNESNKEKVLALYDEVITLTSDIPKIRNSFEAAKNNYIQKSNQ